MKKLLVLPVITILFFSCQDSLESKIEKHYSNKIHDPNSFSFVEIIEIKEIYSIDELKEDIKYNRDQLEIYKGFTSIKNYPHIKTGIKEYTVQIKELEVQIEDMKSGILENSLEKYEVEFSYRAKNTFGALILDTATATILARYGREKYGLILKIED